MITLDGSVRVVRNISLMSTFLSTKFNDLYGIDYDDVLNVVSQILDRKLYTKTQQHVNNFIQKELHLGPDEQIPSFRKMEKQLTKLLATHTKLIFGDQFKTFKSHQSDKYKKEYKSSKTHEQRKMRQQWILNEGGKIYRKAAAICRLCLDMKAAVSDIVQPSTAAVHKIKQANAVKHIKNKHTLLFEFVFSY